MDVKSILSTINIVSKNKQDLIIVQEKMRNLLLLNNAEDIKSGRINLVRSCNDRLEIIFCNGANETVDLILENLNRIRDFWIKDSLHVNLIIQAHCIEEINNIYDHMHAMLSKNVDVVHGNLTYGLRSARDGVYKLWLTCNEQCIVYPIIKINRKSEEKDMQKEVVKPIAILCDTCEHASICKFVDQMDEIKQTIYNINPVNSESPIAVGYTCSCYRSATIGTIKKRG